MDRRSFIMALVGGMAAAGLGGIASAEAAGTAPSSTGLQPLPRREDAPLPEEAVSAQTKEALDKGEAKFTQYYYYRRPRYYARPHYYARPRYYGPRYYARPRYYYRPRRYYY